MYGLPVGMVYDRASFVLFFCAQADKVPFASCGWGDSTRIAPGCVRRRRQDSERMGPGTFKLPENDAEVTTA